VFVVSSAREGFDPAGVLFEPEGLRRHSPPSRDAGGKPAGDAPVGLGVGVDRPSTIAFSNKDHGQDAAFDLSPTLRGGNAIEHANAGVPPAIAFALRGRDEGALPEVHGDGDTVGTLRAADGGSSRDYVAASAVRRLMPVECERLQGYRDGYTAIVWKGRLPTECPDGPRYKALGNSMAIPCMRWIGERVAVEETRRLAELAA
jgi:site-specific DNA-cytosine methylase